MGCAKQGKKPDKDCKEDFNGCSMIAMGMAPPSTTTTERLAKNLISVLIQFYMILMSNQVILRNTLNSSLFYIF